MSSSEEELKRKKKKKRRRDDESEMIDREDKLREKLKKKYDNKRHSEEKYCDRSKKQSSEKYTEKSKKHSEESHRKRRERSSSTETKLDSRTKNSHESDEENKSSHKRRSPDRSSENQRKPGDSDREVKRERRSPSIKREDRDNRSGESRGENRGRQDNAHGRQDNAQRGHDGAHRGQDSAHRGQNSAQRGQDSAQKGQDNAQRGQGSAQRGQDNAQNGDSNNWAADSDSKKVEKEQPNFGLSGKLTEYTNTYNGVVIKYNEPPEARKPKTKWRLYPFKGEEALEMLKIHRQSAFLFGRDRKIADIPVDHPSCSKQQAILQFRLVEYKRDDGSTGKRVRPYLLDLESTNGTFLNNKKIEPRRYVEMREKDVIKFGFSSRDYVILHEKTKEDEPEGDDPGSDGG